MANDTFFLISEEEALAELHQANVADVVNLKDIIGSCSEEIEGFLERRLVTRGTITEFHEPCERSSELDLKQRPLIAVTSVHETTSRVYDSTTKLTEDTDFLVHKDEGVLVRLRGTLRASWEAGNVEPIRVEYTAGYPHQDDVPADIKKVCREYVAMVVREISHKLQNQESVTDSFSTRRRFGPVQLTPGMKARITRYRNISFGGHTWTRSEVAA